MILILGSGLIGGTLAKQFETRKIPFKIFSRTKPSFLLRPFDFREGLWQDIEKHADFFYNVETVIHTISTTVPASSMQNKIQDAIENIETNIKLLDICVNYGVKNLLFISSGGAIYGIPQQAVVDETHPTYPISSYGITKLTTEKYLYLYQLHYGLKTVCLRPSTVYGIGQTTHKPQGVVAHIIKAIREQRSFTVWGDGFGKKDYLYVDDLIEAIFCIVDKNFETQHSIYNLAFGKSYSIREIIHLVEFYTGKKLFVNYEAAKPFDIPSIALQSERFKKEFGWQPHVDLSEGIQKILNSTTL
ncbi:MAG: NAD-dependent epimerase/dehydratase family protein [Cytophagales bacterium]|nr:NAD-dependent epimerase/dehydratase family protein [Cytophagales bacterium]MDW8384426.1 NAD-dependent epimerase/dehydratase family protein [Flammeovirgaceae bacterium]